MEFFATWATVFCVWLAETVLTLGYPGIVFLMAVESSFIPFPSELVMPPAGYLIHEGEMSWAPVILSGVAGSLIGALINYYLALHLGRRFFLRYGKYFLLKPEHLERSERFFSAHGEIATAVGRLVPVVRQFISLPAGLSRMPLGKFCLYTTLGASLWITILTVIGWLVGKNQDMLHEYMRNATLWVLAGAAAAVFVYIKALKRKKERAAKYHTVFEIRPNPVEDSDEYAHSGSYKYLDSKALKLLKTLAAKHCRYVSFAVHSHVPCGEACRAFLGGLEKHLVRKTSTEHPGIEAGTPHTEETYLYELDAEVLRAIDDIDFDAFIAPDLPEDICFHYTETTRMLFSITHEGYYKLYLDKKDLAPAQLDRLLEYFAENGCGTGDVGGDGYY